MNALEWKAIGLLLDVSGARAKAMRLALFQMRDAREITGPAGFELTTEAKAKLYDIQQRIIRAAIDADDRAMADASLDTPATPGEPRDHNRKDRS